MKKYNEGDIRECRLHYIFLYFTNYTNSLPRKYSKKAKPTLIS